jgi:hypothetical protein
MLAEEGQQARRNAGGLQPAFDLVDDFVEALARGSYRQGVQVLADHDDETQFSGERGKEKAARKAGGF